jgi:hypothetical protein
MTGERKKKLKPTKKQNEEKDINYRFLVLTM